MMIKTKTTTMSLSKNLLFTISNVLSFKYGALEHAIDYSFTKKCKTNGLEVAYLYFFLIQCYLSLLIDVIREKVVCFFGFLDGLLNQF